MVDLLRVEANERMDLIDFQYLAQDVLENALRDQGRGFLSNPSGPVTTWILSGFEMSNPVGTKQLTVSKGRALLGYRIGGATNFGMLSLDGDAAKTVDMTALTVGTYNVYIRFEYVDTASTSRVFWDPAGTGQEFTQTIPTRRQANWSMRVETSSPGAEWTKIGTAYNGGIDLTRVDMRKLYFEGAVDATYASGWSTEGGGGANDRNANRQLYGVTDLQSFTAATRQCLEDIKGRGLRRWWSKDIGGMNIGFDGAPAEARLAIGDADMYLQWESAYPYLQMGAGGDAIAYDRAGDHWLFKIAGVEEMRVGTDGMSISNGLFVGDPAGNPVDDAISIMDANFVIAGGASPKIVFDHFLGLEDRLQFSRTFSRFIFTINSGDYATLDATEFAHSNRIRSDGDVIAANVFRFGSAAANDYLAYNDTTKDFDVVIDGSVEYRFGNATMACQTNNIANVGYLSVGAGTALNAGDGMFTRGLNVGFVAAPAGSSLLAVGDANFRLDGSVSNSPMVYFDPTHYLEYSRLNPTTFGWRFLDTGGTIASIRRDATFGGSVFSGSYTTSYDNVSGLVDSFRTAMDAPAA